MTTAGSSDIPQTEDPQEEHSIHTPSTTLTLTPVQGTNILGHPTPHPWKRFRGIDIDCPTILLGLITGFMIFTVGIFGWATNVPTVEFDADTDTVTVGNINSEEKAASILSDLEYMTGTVLKDTPVANSALETYTKTGETNAEYTLETPEGEPASVTASYNPEAKTLTYTYNLNEPSSNKD